MTAPRREFHVERRTSILAALETANRSLGRPAFSSEIARFLTPEVARHVRGRNNKPLYGVVFFVLKAAAKRGIVRIAGRANGRCYFQSSEAPHGLRTSAVPESRPLRVLRVVREIVLARREPVRSVDVMTYGRADDLAGITARNVHRHLKTLTKLGHLKIVSSGRARSPHPAYLPTETVVGDILCRPTTRADGITLVFRELWTEHVDEAHRAGRLPTPLTTGDVRKRYRERFGSVSAHYLTGALRALSNLVKPEIGRIETGAGRIRWAPADVPECALDLSNCFASDAERVQEAVRRAALRLDRPVTAAEVEQEMNADGRLAIVGNQTVRLALQSVAPETISYARGYRRRFRVHVHNVGRIRKFTYYCVDEVDRAVAFVRFNNLRHGWDRWKDIARPDAIGSCCLPTIAVGRALSVKDVIARAKSEIAGVCNGSMNAAVAAEYSVLAPDVAETGHAVEDVLRFRQSYARGLPTTVAAQPGWSLHELWQHLKAVHPTRATAPTHMDQLVQKSIRHVAEFDMRVRRRTRLEDACFDPTDALLWAAIRWGGQECCIQASLCQSELGDLRDPRFVVPALAAEDPQHRLVAIACCAFLWSDAGTQRLRELADSDPEPGVREAAVWAYGFAGGADANRLLSREAAKPYWKAANAKLAPTGDGASWWHM